MARLDSWWVSGSWTGDLRGLRRTHHSHHDLTLIVAPAAGDIGLEGRRASGGIGHAARGVLDPGVRMSQTHIRGTARSRPRLDNLFARVDCAGIGGVREYNPALRPVACVVVL